MIKCGHCKGRHSTVNEIRQCAAPVMPTPTRAPIHRMRLQDAVASIRTETLAHDENQPEYDLAMSESLDDVRRDMALPATEGMYVKDGEIYKVQKAVHGSGHLYAKRLDKDSQKFEYATGMVRQLTQAHKMSLAEAKAYGALYGVCCVCARTLTNEESIEAGIGPICVGRMG
jgi:hypothetical protein